MHEIRGASLFFVICPRTNIYKVKLIDLGSIIPLRLSPEDYTGVSHDPGIIFGVKNFMT